MALRPQKIVIVGAGIGGLAAALELSHAGLPVTVVERAATPGGKLRALPSAAGPVDAGPTVFTLRGHFDALFDACGESLDAHVPLERLDVLARHHWRGSDMLDLHADPGRSLAAVGDFAGARAAREFRAFSARAKALFETFDSPVMRAADPSLPAIALAALRRLPSVMPALLPGLTLSGFLNGSFSDPRLRQLFGRYATYVGGSPYLSPAVLALIWHSEAAGVWAIPGGLHRLARVFEGLARDRGAEFRYGETVAEILVRDGRASGVRLRSGEVVEARGVLYNGDPAALGAGLLGPAARPAAKARAPGDRSLSALVWTFADTPRGLTPSHHNVFFSDDYAGEFRDLFHVRRPPVDPTLYLCAQDRGPGGTPDRSPERFQIIMNAPADGDTATPSEQGIRTCETTVFRRFREAGLTLETPQAENALTTPWDFARMFPGTGGAIYGTAPHGTMATLRRPRARTALPGLYLAGGATHPGPGLPMAMLSGRLAAAAILADRVSTSGSRRTAMRGGMSTASPTTANAASRSSGS